MLAFIGCFIALCFLNIVIFAVIGGNYVSPEIVIVLAIIEMIFAIVLVKPNDEDVQNNLSKTKNKHRSSSKMTADKYGMFRDLNNKK